MGHCVPILRAMRITVPLLILPLLLVDSLAAPVPTFTETITLTTGILPILLAKLLFLKGAVLGNVLAEAPERLTALSKLQGMCRPALHRAWATVCMDVYLGYARRFIQGRANTYMDGKVCARVCARVRAVLLCTSNMGNSVHGCMF